MFEEVLRVGHPIVDSPTRPVEPEDLAFVRWCTTPMLARAMRDEMQGIGIAANQVGVGMSFFVVMGEFFDGLQADEAPVTKQDGIVINPVIRPVAKDRSSMKEGCLSCRGFKVPVSRPDKIEMTFLDSSGQERTVRLEGMPARVCQHEADHLKGVYHFNLARPQFLKKASTVRLIKKNKAVAKTQSHIDETFEASLREDFEKVSSENV